jgi:hypothetical protein
MEPATDYVLRWEKLETAGDLPTSDGLHGHSMIVPQHQEGSVLVFGGSCNGWTYSDNYSISIDGTKSTWKKMTPKTELPVIADHQTVLYKNKYLITYGMFWLRVFFQFVLGGLKEGFLEGGRGHAQRRNHVDSYVVPNFILPVAGVFAHVLSWTGLLQGSSATGLQLYSRSQHGDWGTENNTWRKGLAEAKGIWLGGIRQQCGFILSSMLLNILQLIDFSNWQSFGYGEAGTTERFTMTCIVLI